MSEGVPAIGAKCRGCAHVWIVAYAPIELHLAAEAAKRAMCPKCGDPKPTVAKDAEVLAVLAKEAA